MKGQTEPFDVLGVREFTGSLCPLLSGAGFLDFSEVGDQLEPELVGQGRD